MDCQFEEKQFEQHFNATLLNGRNLMYAPGQVLENLLGFDAAFLTSNRLIWRRFPRRSRRHFFRQFPRGVRLDKKWWNLLDNDIEWFPKFKFNLFLQYKRPQFLTTPNAREWNHWKCPFFRYKLVSHQQRALLHLVGRIKGDGAVIYVSPAFHLLSSLWEAIHQHNLIDQSNFAEAINLNGHSRYSYIDAGSTGKCHSEADDITSYGLKEQLQKLFESPRTYEKNRSFIVDLGNTVDSIMPEIESYEETYHEIASFLSEDVLDIDLAVALIRIDVFCFLTRTSWRIGFV